MIIIIIIIRSNFHNVNKNFHNAACVQGGLIFIFKKSLDCNINTMASEGIWVVAC